MYFQPYGPFELRKDAKGLLLYDKDARTELWDEADEIDEGLPDACGCYIFAIRAGKGVRPWYVGKAEKQSFKSECFTPHKLVHYNSALVGRKGTPLLYLYARLTNQRASFSKPTKSSYSDVSFLETMLIGLALRRNPDLLNRQGVKHLQQMVVPGLLNGGKGKPSAAELEFQALLDY